MLEIAKIVSQISEVGIELDDLNKDNIVIYNDQNAMIGSMRIKILYDERDREYDKLLRNITSLPNGNKCFWSTEKLKA